MSCEDQAAGAVPASCLEKEPSFCGNCPCPAGTYRDTSGNSEMCLQAPTDETCSCVLDGVEHEVCCLLKYYCVSHLAHCWPSYMKPEEVQWLLICPESLFHWVMYISILQCSFVLHSLGWHSILERRLRVLCLRQWRTAVCIWTMPLDWYLVCFWGKSFSTGKPFLSSKYCSFSRVLKMRTTIWKIYLPWHFPARSKPLCKIYIL